ncbi:MAG: gliding motility-associated C-terminal domain-containing protein [Brumimicrobium sp.]
MIRLLKITHVVISVLIANTIIGQSDGCSFSPALSVTANCSTPTAGTSTGATQTITGCSGNADDDVWYEFVATSASHQIQVGASGGYDPVVQVFFSTCNSLISLGCQDNYATGIDETFNYSNFIPGETYKVRVYHWGAGAGTGDFTICVTTPSPPPSNDDCSGAIALNVENTCNPQSFTTDGATNSIAGCSGNADDDVWFSFVATNSVQDIIVDPTSSMDLVVQLYEDNCSSLNSLSCMDNTFTGDQEEINAVGLTPGETYYFRVYDYYTGTTGDFDVCIVGTPTPSPTNDDPCDAILMPPVTSTCNYATFNNSGATTTSDAGIPDPSNCAGGSGAQIGGFTSGTADVWFQIVVPSTGNINITAEPNLGSGALTDGVMALYSGDCSNMTQIACADDYTNYPGSSHDLLPMITESNLNPGDTLYLRYWGFGTNQGDFGFCVNTAVNDDCVDALYICDINGYSASTSAAFTDTRPSNMRGNAEENDPPAYTYTPGTNTGGIFGQGGPWGSGSTNYDVRIDNNSWISFTASDITAVLNVSVIDCWIGNYPNGGIQMQIFDANNCTNFVPVSNFEENSTGFTITANNLTVGNDYYLMVDGYAGDICSYTISANSGVQFPDIPDVPSICFGETTTLTAPSDATSYEWQHNGATTQSVTVSPGATTTYVCEVTGLCDYKQMLDVEVEVKPLPNISFSTGNSTTICEGESVTITANGADSYEWNTGQLTQSITVSPSTTTTYTVTGTTDGCESSDQVDVNVNQLPTLTTNPSSTDADCGVSNGDLTGGVVSGTPNYTYSWTNGSGTVVGTSLDLNNIPAGLYSLEITDGNSCSEDFGPFSVANPGAPDAPDVTVSSNEGCEGDTVEFTVSSADASATFDWSGPNGFVSTDDTFSITLDQNTSGNYCAVATVANCTSPSTCEIISVNSLPDLIVSSDSEGDVVCANSSVELTASGASSYEWSGPNGFNAVGSPVDVNNTSVSSSGWYVLTGVDGNNCSSVDSTFVEVVSLPEADAAANSDSQETFCEGSVGFLYGSGGDTFTWTGSNNFNSSQQNPVIANFNFENEGIYLLTVVDENGCEDEDSINLLVSDFNDVEISAGDTVLCPGETLQLTATGATDYDWSGPGNFSESGQNIMIENISLNQGGVYIVEGTNEFGCSGEDSVEVEVIMTSDCLFIPELVTPNEDNMNDFWVITGITNYTDAEVLVYNRWGNLVFSASPYENDWGGQVNRGLKIGGDSGLVPSGTYFYVVKLNDGVTDPFKGYIELQY